VNKKKKAVLERGREKVEISLASKSELYNFIEESNLKKQKIHLLHFLLVGGKSTKWRSEGRFYGANE